MPELIKVTPAAHHVLIKVDLLETQTKTGIVLQHENPDRVENAKVTGTVAAVGKTAWTDFGDGHAWAKPGDRVLYSSHAGCLLMIKGEKYRLVNDEDVVATIEEAE